MIVEELAARFGFTIDGLEKVRRAVQMLMRLQKAILAVAGAIARRLGRVGSILAKMTGLALAFGSAFVTSTVMITTSALAASAAMAGLAATFAKLRQATVNSAFLSGVPIQELALVEKLMTRIGASAKDGQSFISDFAKKVREGVKEGGDWAETLAKQGVKLKDAKGKAKSYSQVIDDILRAADKIRDTDKKRDFLKEGLEGAPDELIVQLLQATSALKRWEQLVGEARKAGGNMPLGDVLNAGDITNALGKMNTAFQGFVDAFGSGAMANFARNFRELGDAVMSIATDENRAGVRKFANDLSQFVKDVTKGGFIVLGKIAGAISSIVDAAAKADAATGGKLKQIGIGIGGLITAIGVVAAGPIVSISAAITGMLWGIQKFSEWKEGKTNALSDFFDTIAAAANAAKDAINGVVEAFKSLPDLNIFPRANPGAGEAGKKAGETIGELFRKQAERSPSTGTNLGEFIGQLLRKQAELSPGAVMSRVAGDRQASRGDTHVTATATATSSATFNGIFDATAVQKIKGMIDTAINEASSKFATSIGKAANVRPAPTNGSSSP